MIRKASRIQKNIPLKLTLTIVVHCSSDRSSSKTGGAFIPALLNRTSSRPNDILVFCDVTDLKYAKKVEQLGADAVIAVCKEAGGHAGPKSYTELIPELSKSVSIPVISAGGIGTGQGIRQMIELGAEGVSMGSIFIATNEAPVSEEYKQA